MRSMSMQRSITGIRRDSRGDRGPCLLLCCHGAVLLLLPLNHYHQHLDLLRKDSKPVLLVRRRWRWSVSTSQLRWSSRYNGLQVWLVEASCTHIITMTCSSGERMLTMRLPNGPLPGTPIYCHSLTYHRATAMEWRCINFLWQGLRIFRGHYTPVTYEKVLEPGLTMRIFRYSSQ